MKENNISRKLFQGDVSVWIIFMLLCCFSIVEVFSATSTLAYREVNIYMPIVRHASFLFGGFLVILIFSHVHFNYFSLGIFLMFVSVVLLVLTLLYGITENEATRRISAMGTPFQPSEIGKLASVIYIAVYLSKGGAFTNSKKSIFISCGVGIIVALILRANLSTALILGAVCFLMMFIGQIPLLTIGRRLFEWVGIACVVVILLLVLPPETAKKVMPRTETWRGRIERFIDQVPNSTRTDATSAAYQITDDNYQTAHAKIAIARGGILGKLPGQSVQRDFLPQAYSDFIYAIIIEELGAIGGITVLLLYVMLMIRVGIIARRCEKLFPKYLVLGCGLLIVIQALVHMAVSVGLPLVTGQPLPLISIGGTSIVITCVYIGMILSVSHYGAKMSEEEDEEEEEEKDEALDYDENLEENPTLATEFVEEES